MTHPRHGLDEVIHAPVRFSIVAALTAADKAEFAYIRDLVEVTNSVLSKQVAVLENAGYLAVVKGYVGKRPRTWLSLTQQGRTAFATHCAALRTIADGARRADPDASDPPTARTNHETSSANSARS